MLSRSHRILGRHCVKHFGVRIKMNRTTSGASSRNKVHIVDHVRTLVARVKTNLPSERPIKVLEVASGTGEHAQYFNTEIAGLLFQPTEPDVAMHDSIRSWSEGLSTILSPLPLNVLEYSQQWTNDRTPLPLEFSPGEVDLMICINMVHISPWECTTALMKMAGELLAPGRTLLLYGPYRVNGHMVESNVAFDENLKGRNPEWGVRDLEDVIREASSNGLTFEGSYDVPANNLTVYFTRNES